MSRDDRAATTASVEPSGTAITQKRLLVVGLCAAWCNTCGEFQAGFDRLAAARGDGAFVWLDIEDDAELVGDIEVDNFPTIALFIDRRLVHFGVSLPQASIVARMLDAVDAATPTFAADDSVIGLPERLAAMTPDATRRVVRPSARTRSSS